MKISVSQMIAIVLLSVPSIAGAAIVSGFFEGVVEESDRFNVGEKARLNFKYDTTLAPSPRTDGSLWAEYYDYGRNWLTISLVVGPEMTASVGSNSLNQVYLAKTSTYSVRAIDQFVSNDNGVITETFVDVSGVVMDFITPFVDSLDIFSTFDLDVSEYYLNTGAWSTGTTIYDTISGSTLFRSNETAQFRWNRLSSYIVEVPEPSTLYLLGLGIISVGVARLRRVLSA